jgi:sigma-B regulation protein RsbU (phosphoserine phosphatase)
LQQVIEELRLTWPARVIDADIHVPEAIDGDTARLARLLSNLLANALAHGAAERPITVRGSTKDGVLEISVANKGNPIAPAAMERLFQPFFRGAVRANHQGLGLGLYIASEIARAHGGTLKAISTPAETRFTFRMPVR